MEAMPIPPEILDHARGTMFFDLSETPHSVSGIATYRCKVYRARLDQETERYFVAIPGKSFPKHSIQARLH